MQMNIESFFIKCQEPTLIKFNYELGVAQFTIQLYENDEKIIIKSKTKRIYSNFTQESCNNVAVFTPFKEELSGLLCVENGVYVPNKNFFKFMEEVRHNLNLAYGLRKSQNDKIIIFSGSFNISFIPDGDLFLEKI